MTKKSKNSNKLSEKLIDADKLSEKLIDVINEIDLEKESTYLKMLDLSAMGPTKGLKLATFMVDSLHNELINQCDEINILEKQLLNYVYGHRSFKFDDDDITKELAKRKLDLFNAANKKQDILLHLSHWVEEENNPTIPYD